MNCTNQPLRMILAFDQRHQKLALFPTKKMEARKKQDKLWMKKTGLTNLKPDMRYQS